jgi:hypothetical protein
MASVGVTECSLNTTPVYTLYVNRMNFQFSVQWVPVLFLGVKRSGRDVTHPPPSSAEVKGRVKLYLYSLSGPPRPVLGRTLPLPRLEYRIM